MKREMLITFVNDKNNTILDSDNFANEMFITGDVIQNKYLENCLIKSVSVDLKNNKMFVYVQYL